MRQWASRSVLLVGVIACGGASNHTAEDTDGRGPEDPGTAPEDPHTIQEQCEPDFMTRRQDIGGVANCVGQAHQAGVPGHIG